MLLKLFLINLFSKAGEYNRMKLMYLLRMSFYIKQSIGKDVFIVVPLYLVSSNILENQLYFLLFLTNNSDTAS